MKTPPHPHLVPAIRTWMLETFEVVHLHIRADMITDPVLLQYEDKDIIVLSVGHASVPYFNVTSEAVSFSCRFSGVARDISIPPTSIVNVVGFNRGAEGERYFFPLPDWSESTPTEEPKSKRPSLTVVK